MPYVTQGVVKVILGIDNKIRIIPTTDYRIKHECKTYTVFIESATKTGRCFEETQDYDFEVAVFKDYLVKAALKNVHLRITIDDSSTSPKVTVVQIPA